MTEAKTAEIGEPKNFDLFDFLARFAPTLFLIALMAFFAVAEPRFLSSINLFNVMRQVSITGLLALSMTFVILTAGIDLAPSAEAPGKRGFEALNSSFHDNDMMLRVAGDTLALTPPLIISEDQIGEIVEKVGKVIRAVA